MVFVAIGLEIHVALKTDRKAFAPESSDGSSWVSLGFIGTLPTINVEAVEQVIRLSASCNCSVNHRHITFDRKNYFYYDLPRGFQITQYFNPLGTGGHIRLSTGKRIGIRQIHMEEDTAQQFKRGDCIGLNFSRLGRALAEVVTEPDFCSYQEVEEFLIIFRRLCLFNGVSNAAYEAGEMRVDLNISVRKKRDDPLGVKSEVKNLNSLQSIRNSIDCIVDIQRRNIAEGKAPEALTYTWSEKENRCEVMRKKSGSSDYFYVPEANIPPLSISDERCREITSNLITDFAALSDFWRSQGLKEPEAEFLLNNHQAFTYVFRLNEQLNNLLSSYNWMINVVSGMMENLDWASLPYSEIEKTILEAEKTRKINMKIAKSILKEILVNGLTFKEANRKLNVSLITDPKTIKRLVQESFDQYREQIPSLKSNLFRLEKLIIGECMKRSRGQADPVLVKAAFDEVVASWG